MVENIQVIKNEGNVLFFCNAKAHILSTWTWQRCILHFDKKKVFNFLLVLENWILLEVVCL